MSHIFVHSERMIQAKPAKIFDALADYIHQHPRILPANFLGYRVEQGGHGQGTVIHYRLQAAGRERPYTMQVEETIKGQVLTERDKNSSFVTRWSVVPTGYDQQSKVRIESDWQGAKGIGGFFERTFAPLGLRKMYKEILNTLAQLVQTPEQGPKPKIMLADKKQLKRNMAAMMMALGAALGIAVSVNYWLNRQHV